MKATKANIGAAVDRPDPKIRFFLLYGPDEAQSRALRDRLLKALGATKFLILSSAIRSDPAALADEAAAMSLFGGKRAICIEPAGDEIAEGVAVLLDAPSPESVVVAIAGALRKTSALLKLAEVHANALAYAAYVPEGRDADRMVSDLARTFGLKLSPGVDSRIAAACGNDQALADQELRKLALYLDAAPERPRDVDHEALDAVGSGVREGDFARLSELALSGNGRDLIEELRHLAESGADTIPALRSLQRRLLSLAPMRAKVERGARSNDVMASAGKALFWKEKASVARWLEQWNAAALARIASRISRLERRLMAKNPPPASAALGEDLTAIARAGARRR